MPVDGVELMQCIRFTRGRGRPGSLEGFELVPKFLRTAFAEVGAVGGGEFGRLVWADVFCDADERDFVGTPAGPLRGTSDALPNAL